MAKYAVGQRVIVTQQIVPSVDLTGYYGHVVTVDEPGGGSTLFQPIYGVSVQGRAGGKPALSVMLDHDGADPALFFESELEAAD